MKILVAGIARSGTTWVGETMAHAPDTAYVHEPDNPGYDPFARVATRGTGRYGYYPVLPDQAPGYGLMWDLAFRGGWPRGLRRAHRILATRPSPRRERTLAGLARTGAAVPPRRRHVVVKSVLCPLTLGWVAAREGATVVVVRRPLVEVVGSWIERAIGFYPLHHEPEVQRRWLEPLGLPGPSPTSERARVAWTVALLDEILEEAVRAHPEWVVVDHAELCRDPLGGFRALLDRVGLPWGEAVERFLAERNQPGEGFEARRVASDEVGRRRRAMAPAELAEVEAVFAAFPQAHAQVA